MELFSRARASLGSMAAGSDANPHDSDGEEEETNWVPEAFETGDKGTDAVCDRWFWGHTDSKVEPPPDIPSLKLEAATLPLKLTGANSAFYQEFAKYVMCPHYLDRVAMGTAPASGQGCPFLGGKGFVRHADVSRQLEQVPADHASGAIDRKNELGYLLLQSEPFPGGTLGLGNSVEDHRVQRRVFEHLLSAQRLPSRRDWVEEAKAFLLSRREQRAFSVRKELAKWWQQMLWKHVLGDELTADEASAFVKFQSGWLSTALVAAPAALVGLASRLSSKVWTVQKVLAAQAEYRARIARSLPADVPADKRELAAQGVLEMFVFAGGLSVPQTMHCVVAALFSDFLLPSPVTIAEDNVLPFVYEVTRLLPAVQGFCFWRGGERQILSLNAALRDPAVWGRDANRFTSKPLDLYKSKHVGFAQPAKSAPGTFDSKACPGYDLAIEATCGFVLALAAWQPCTSPGRPLAYFSPVKFPKPLGVEKKWFGEFALELQDWLDGDQTGESLLRDLGAVDMGRLLQTIGQGDADDGMLAALMGAAGPKKDRRPAGRMGACDLSSRLFYELSRKRFKELSERAGSQSVDQTPPGRAPRYFDLDFGGKSPMIHLPVNDSLKKKIRDSFAGIMSEAMSSKLSDECPQAVVLQKKEYRAAAVMLCQQAFHREGEKPPPNSAARPDSYLPKAKSPFKDVTADGAQAGIAFYGMGQLFLRTNDSPQLSGLGEVICDCSAVSGFPVRQAFERLGAVASFRRGQGDAWELTAIDWRHGDKVVKPGEPGWEHAKFAWRCSLITHMTVVHHLVWTHWIVANALASSSRETLGPDHPVRRLLQIVTYNTYSINHNSALSLFPEAGMLHRMSCFHYEQLQGVFAHAAETWSFKTWPEVYAETQLPEGVKAKLPIFEDGLPLWQALCDFVAGYISAYYPGDAEVQADKELQEYWKFRCVPQYARQLPPLAKQALIDQIARGIFDVTVLHEIVGDVVEYTTDPAGAALQVRSGADMADLQQFLQVNSLVAGTGTPMPMFVPSGETGDEEWLPQLDIGLDGGRPFAQVSALYKTLMETLRRLSAEVRQRNAPGNGRPRPFLQMDPLNMERSVSL